MNKEIRKQLEELADQLDSIVSELTEIAETEQEKYNNTPDNLKDSERILLYYECADHLNSICADIDNAIEDLRYNVIGVY